MDARDIYDRTIRYGVRLLVTLCTMTSLSTGVSLNVVTVPENDLTCWTCPNKTNNEACNNWAPDVNCPKNFTWCMSVHRVDVVQGKSLIVHKMCALPSACTKDSIGCKETGEPGVQECVSCCNVAYCNEAIPFNHTSALQLSSVMTSSVPANHTPSYITMLLAAFLLVLSNCCYGDQLSALATALTSLCLYVAMVTIVFTDRFLLLGRCLLYHFTDTLSEALGSRDFTPSNQLLTFPSPRKHFYSKTKTLFEPEFTKDTEHNLLSSGHKPVVS